jgi:hypothetical protein
MHQASSGEVTALLVASMIRTSQIFPSEKEADSACFPAIIRPVQAEISPYGLMLWPLIAKDFLFAWD